MPKGYNDRAMKGMLEFLKGCFEVILQEVADGKDPVAAMKEELAEIERRLKDDPHPTSVRFPE